MYNEIERWIDNILSKELPSEIRALNFNLYEEENDLWSMELVGTSSFDLIDEDWACDEIFDTREVPIRWEQIAPWEEVLEEMSGLINQYLEKGKYAEKIKAYQGVGIGFVDGDLKLLYIK